jgi:DNA recombination protein RmuC
MTDVLLGLLALTTVLAGGLIWLRLARVLDQQRDVAEQMALLLEEKHRAITSDLHEGLQRQGEALNRGFLEQSERLRTSLGESSDRLRESLGQGFDRLREAVATELRDTRVGLEQLRQTQAQALSEQRETLMRQLAELATSTQQRQDALRAELLESLGKLVQEQGRAQQELLANALRRTTEQLTQSIGQLTQTVEARLEQISGKVGERLEEGFKKTNETFVSVMARLAVIDEAQRKIDGLTSNVVNLQELLGDKRARGAFGEVQLEHLVRNVLPATSYGFQVTLSNGTRADCVLDLPPPTGRVAVDAKFPLENYHRMFADGGEAERTVAQRAFRADVKRHLDAIADKYIVPGETADGALMFVPAEAVFAEIHAYHPELVQHAMQRRVWIVSPTTMMAVLNTARAVIKDVETRRQVHIIQEALGKLGREFERFDQRMKKLADHIRMAHEDAQQVQVTSEKISRRFNEIEHVRLEDEAPRLGTD